MRTVYLSNDTIVQGNYAATVGFFDGVHRGHLFVLEQLKNVSASRGLCPMVITFERHPRQVVQQAWRPQLLSTLDEKVRLLEDTGIDTLVVLRFDEQMASLTAYEFMSRVLATQLNVHLLLAGYDNRFGRGRSEGFDDYVRYGQSLGIEVVRGEALKSGNGMVSSSRIRHLLADGQVEDAARCLGYCYQIGGSVVHGEHIGRTLGFPTANLQPDDANKLIPKDGVYAVTVTIDNGEPLPGVTNIGLRPTFNGMNRTLETHILAPCDDLYGHRLCISFVARLRDEQAFASTEELVSQMEKDKAEAMRRIVDSL